MFMPNDTVQRGGPSESIRIDALRKRRDCEWVLAADINLQAAQTGFSDQRLRE